MGTWVWTASNPLGFLQQTALPSLRIRAKLHHGYALAMVTLPKRCRGSALSPWLLINPPSVVWSQQISLLWEKTFRCRLGVLSTCLRRLYWTRCSGRFHFKRLIGQRHVPAVLRSYTAWLVLLYHSSRTVFSWFFLFLVTTFKENFSDITHASAILVWNDEPFDFCMWLPATVTTSYDGVFDIVAVLSSICRKVPAFGEIFFWKVLKL